MKTVQLSKKIIYSILILLILIGAYKIRTIYSIHFDVKSRLNISLPIFGWKIIEYKNLTIVDNSTNYSYSAKIFIKNCESFKTELLKNEYITSYDSIRANSISPMIGPLDFANTGIWISNKKKNPSIKNAIAYFDFNTCTIEFEYLNH